MDGALGELALSVELLLEEHRVSTAVDLGEDILHFGDTASSILSDSVAELLQAEEHAVEVLDGLTKTTLGDDGEDFLELTEGGTSIVGCLGGKLAHAHALGDEAADTPVVLPIMVVVLLGFLEVGEEVEVLTLCFGIPFGFEALTHRVGYDGDIALQDFDTGEDQVVHTLQDPAWCPLAVRDDIGIVDVSIAKRLHLPDLSSGDELADNMLHIRMIHL